MQGTKNGATRGAVGVGVSCVKTGECAVGAGIGEAVGVAEPASGTGEPHKDTRTTMAGVMAMNSRTTD